MNVKKGVELYPELFSALLAARPNKTAKMITEITVLLAKGDITLSGMYPDIAPSGSSFLCSGLILPGARLLTTAERLKPGLNMLAKLKAIVIAIAPFTETIINNLHTFRKGIEVVIIASRIAKNTNGTASALIS